MSTTTRPANLPAFRKAAEATFRRANPDATDAVIVWVESARVSRWHDGSSGFRGRFVVTADGHRSRAMNATWCSGMMVR